MCHAKHIHTPASSRYAGIGSEDVTCSTRRGHEALTTDPPGSHHPTSNRSPVARTQECTMSDFKPGLEGVIAFETEIAEPDREGGALRYRGVDIEDLIG